MAWCGVVWCSVVKCSVVRCSTVWYCGGAVADGGMGRWLGAYDLTKEQWENNVRLSRRGMSVRMLQDEDESR